MSQFDGIAGGGLDLSLTGVLKREVQTLTMQNKQLQVAGQQAQMFAQRNLLFVGLLMKSLGLKEFEFTNEEVQHLAINEYKIDAEQTETGGKIIMTPPDILHDAPVAEDGTTEV